MKTGLGFSRGKSVIWHSESGFRRKPDAYH